MNRGVVMAQIYAKAALRESINRIYAQKGLPSGPLVVFHGHGRTGLGPTFYAASKDG